MDSTEGVEMEFQTVQKGFFSKYEKPACHIVQEEQRFADLWNQLDVNLPRCLTPDVDFSNSTIIAVFMGQVSTGGYSIEVKKIVDMCRSVVVRVEKIHPSGESMVTQALTQPYHIVKVEKINKKIEFEIVEIKDCKHLSQASI